MGKFEEVKDDTILEKIHHQLFHLVEICKRLEQDVHYLRSKGCSDLIQMTIDLPEDIYKILEKKALDDCLTLNEYIKQWMISIVESDEPL